MQDKDKNEMISIIKEWASPILMGIVGMLIWKDMTEMKSDVKLMLVQNASYGVRINMLENEVNLLKQNVARLQIPPEKK